MVDLGAVANRLFEGFLAPLVLGGEMKPGRPIGARAALALGRDRTLVDIDLVSHVELARTRVARRLMPLDRVPRITEAEWALAATLHDLVQSTHPGFDAAFRRSAPVRLLTIALAALERIPSPTSVGDALGRHTWFARLFEMQRMDTTVRWWVGSSTFLGETPPARLMAWPELRRVRVETSPRTMMDLPKSGSAVDASMFASAVTSFLAKTPLTDLATIHRGAPAFLWSTESLGLVATAPGRALAMRALAQAPKGAVDARLGRATRSLVEGQAWKAASVALDLLAERAVYDAEVVRDRNDSPPAAPKDVLDDAAYARCLGAAVACQELRSSGAGFTDVDRAELLARLTPLASAPAVQEVAVTLFQAR
jgi:hypothetical protein